MQDNPLFQRINRSIRYVEGSYIDQDATVIEQLLRAMQQQTITIEFMPDLSIIDESKCVEGSISEVHDA